jgi:formylglycine-generating enzyme required for sulfatase activity
MKWNGSRFRSSERPVESVGWNDTQAFCSRLAGRFRDLDFGLPTEAQWEYACRAGSSGATYAGELEVLGINHAPVLDAIAWYAGNSGHRFELAVGEDASSWPETQYPFTRAGTRTVGQKIANAWGLFDMLGNVWEWCQDEWQEQYGIPPTIADGVLRTIRGGSFRSAPANLRAARRDRKSSSTKSIDLGFRFLCQERDLSKK